MIGDALGDAGVVAGKLRSVGAGTASCATALRTLVG